jgi:hypothetical protein
MHGELLDARCPEDNVPTKLPSAKAPANWSFFIRLIVAMLFWYEGLKSQRDHELPIENIQRPEVKTERLAMFPL